MAPIGDNQVKTLQFLAEKFNADNEPTEGFAPQIVERVAAFIVELRRRGVAVLLVEQKLTIALEIADRCSVMGRGRVVFEGTSDALRAADGVRKE
jgi:branched-chain amino acid transport system ATP-binding protein